jgi:hypothetical protein
LGRYSPNIFARARAGWEAGQPDIMHSNGVYDGRFNLDPVTDSNSIRRAYMVAALQSAPQEILKIGLATGS